MIGGKAAEKVSELGALAYPREILLAVGSSLLRVAPAADRRVERTVSFGFLAFLIGTLLLQAIPLGVSIEDTRTTPPPSPTSVGRPGY